MLPIDGQYYCRIILHNIISPPKWYLAQYYPQTTQYFQVAQFILKSFNTVNNIAQSFNLTYKRPILLRNLRYCAIILSVEGPLYACARHITSIIDYISLRKNVDDINFVLYIGYLTTYLV